MKGLLFVSMIATATMAQNVVDVHSHIITADFMTALKNEGRQMDEGFPLPDYDVENHLRWMDEAGVGMSVLTLAAPQPQSQALSLNIEGEDCGEKTVIRLCNETAARIKRKHPERFLFCAALPLPDVSKAIEEARYALDVLKADGMLCRLAEIEVHPQYLKDYLAAAAEIQTTSLAEEPGVLCLFPTQTKEDTTQIRILEIYASQQAYQHHIQTSHFKKYKQGTLHMVKHLKLQDLQPLMPETFNAIFKR